MRYIKLYENKITEFKLENDIKDIFIELEDIGYSVSVICNLKKNSSYIGSYYICVSITNGNKVVNKEEVKEYFEVFLDYMNDKYMVKNFNYEFGFINDVSITNKESDINPKTWQWKIDISNTFPTKPFISMLSLEVKFDNIVNTSESYGKRRKIPLEDKKILSDMSDIFIELTDKGFVRNTFIGVIGGSKLKDHNTDTLYLCIAKPKNLVQWRRGLEHEEGYDISLEDTGETMVSFFDSIYFDDTLQLFEQDEVKEHVLMFVDYMKGLWGDNIEVDLPNNSSIDDKYYVRIKKRL